MKRALSEAFNCLALCMNLNANSVAFINFSNLENRLKGIVGNTPPSEIVLWNTVDFTKSLLLGLLHSRLCSPELSLENSGNASG